MDGQWDQDRLYVTVDLLILTVRSGQLCLLLFRREKPPYAGRWALPGRLIGPDESAETAASLLLTEMLPVRCALMEQLYTFTDVNRDPRGRVISTAYLVIVPWDRLQAQLAAGETKVRCFQAFMDAKGLRLQDGTGCRLIPGDLAFDHGRIIETGIQRLRGKIDYTDIGFHFLADPHAFTLGELQTVFEAVLGEPADSSNFRRTILNRYEKTGRLTQVVQAERRGRGRPAAVYNFT